ncbi:ABC transporter family protein [Burkholderia cepacia]|nr:ABC transporter family protein [Burkholderia cepacia]
MTQGAHIVANGVSLRYGSRSVLNGVDLSVAPGELVALLGPSGCGKSSLLRAIAGLTRTASGTIRVDGEPVDGPRPEVALAFQDPCLLPWLTVERNVGFGLTFARQPHLTRADRKERGRTLWPPSGSIMHGTRCLRSCRAAWHSARRWRAASRGRRARCCSTNRSARSTK